MPAIRARTAPARPWLVEAARIGRFAAVGVAATLCHYGVALAVHGGLHAPLVLAHAAGFLAAVPLSFLGHYHWTFKSSADYGRAARHFGLVAVSAFLVSAAVLEAVANLTTWEAAASVLVGIVAIPAATYLINRSLIF